MMLIKILILLTLALASQIVVSASIASEQSKQDLEDKYQPPRFLFYKSRPFKDFQAGLKRSSSGLDPLAGLTLGKRSNAPMELINLEPIFGRQYSMRSMPRMYDLRWAPLDSYEGPSVYEMSY